MEDARTSGALDRPDRAEPETSLHVLAELVTAVLLLSGGIILLSNDGRRPALVGLGMLTYAAIASPGVSWRARSRPWW